MLDSVKEWFSKHRKAVMITATVVSITGTVAILLIKGKKVEIPVDEIANKLIPAPYKLPSAVAQTVEDEVDGIEKTFFREGFIRHLHEGWNASNEKIAEAAEKGIHLNPGETYVNPCTVKMKIPA